MKRPAPSEHDPYFQVYIDLVPGADLIRLLESVHEETQALIAGISEERAGYRYARDKWSIKEILVHLVDCERVYAYRALAFARGDRTELPGFDHDDYVRASGADARTLADLAAEYEAVRTSTLALFRSFDEAVLGRRGIANQNPITVRALGFGAVGHEIHHRNVIRERYLAG